MDGKINAFILIAFAVAMAIYGMGEAYHSFRLFYVGKMVELEVESCREMPGGRYSNPYTLIKAKGFDESIKLVEFECYSIGKCLMFKYVPGMGIRRVYSKSLARQIYTEIKANLSMAVMSLPFVMYGFIQFVKRGRQKFMVVYRRARASYSIRSNIGVYQLINRNLFITYQLLPSIMIVYINWILLLKVGQGLLLVEGVNSFLCGCLMALYLCYLFLLSPYLIEWLYELKFGNNEYVVLLRTGVQIVLLLYFMVTLTRSLLLDGVTFKLTTDNFLEFLGVHM
ncbi:MAG: hypothetical protein SFW35_07845 [Chitinophagales bacterium]|nr:hypothetical protein [Chitinophagales bacterium]